MTSDPQSRRAPLRVLFLVEGFTDIRYVAGLSQICDLTMAVPARAYESSGLKQRIAESNVRLNVHEIPGGRLTYQGRSLAYLLREARKFDVILAQEVTRGALNANLAGRLLRVPALNTLMTAPVDYFRCKRERRLIPAWKYGLGHALISTLMSVNGRLSSGWLALGPYLCGVAAQRSRHVRNTHYYGVDTDYFRPVDQETRRAIRASLGLREHGFIVLISSRVSHEKDPETALRAVAEIRARGLDAIALNLSGGYQQFVSLARELGFSDAETWVVGRPAAHPMRELARYYQAADVVMQASLAEGLGLSPLESLACGTPVVATAVGGMAEALPGYARLVARGDYKAAAEQLVWVAEHEDEARAQALVGREYVVRDWSRELAFTELQAALAASAKAGALHSPAPAPAPLAAR